MQQTDKKLRNFCIRDDGDCLTNNSGLIYEDFVRNLAGYGKKGIQVLFRNVYVSVLFIDTPRTWY